MVSWYICGAPRSGTTLLHMMLLCTVTNYRVSPREGAFIETVKGIITKHPNCIAEDKPKGFSRIVMIRDPRSIITSILSKKHYGDDYFIGWANGQGASSMARKGLKSYVPYLLAADANEIIRYEQLVASPASQQMRFTTFEYSGNWGDFHKNGLYIPDDEAASMNGIRPLDSGHDWRDHLPRIREQFGKHPELFKAVTDLGYEKDDSWYEQIKM